MLPSCVEAMLVEVNRSDNGRGSGSELGEAGYGCGSCILEEVEFSSSELVTDGEGDE